MNERRRSRRATPGRAIDVTIGGNRPARMVDITPFGAHLELTSALNPRGEVRLTLPLPDGTVRIKARVVHCKLTSVGAPGQPRRPTYRAGLEFLDVEPRLAAMIGLVFPAPVERKVRQGPIKVKVDIDALDHDGIEGPHRVH
ncbi:MAG: PilZ domain-containing protein [Thermoanaerobaculales bacterium]|jgi:hypothetical protein|nr:PilZ domain-containing protein [Thermoanaerobaculales bacterium]